MSLTPLLPIAGAAIGGLASRVTEAVHESFADVLQRVVSSDRAVAKSDDVARTGAADTTGDVIKHIRSEDSEALEQFRQLLTERLSAAGVDLSVPIQLRGDGFGRLIVEGDHPDRAVIEQVLGEDMTLAALFNDLAANLQRPESADSELLAEAGTQARILHGDVSSTEQLDFSVTVYKDAIEAVLHSG